MNLEDAKITQDKKNNKIYSFKDISEWNLNSKIYFKGKNNILFIAKDAKFKDSNISFSGDDSLVFVGNSLSSAKSEICGAVARIQNQLSYKLGKAMIENSKSFKTCIILPLTLLKISQKHQKEKQIYEMLVKLDPNLALPKLENYTDYTEALKVKNHLSYKLGKALIDANNIKWGGG